MLGSTLLVRTFRLSSCHTEGVRMSKRKRYSPELKWEAVAGRRSGAGCRQK